MYIYILKVFIQATSLVNDARYIYIGLFLSIFIRYDLPAKVFDGSRRDFTERFYAPSLLILNYCLRLYCIERISTAGKQLKG